MQFRNSDPEFRPGIQLYQYVAQMKSECFKVMSNHVFFVHEHEHEYEYEYEENVMYDKLARGHATACINSIKDYEGLLKWLDGPRYKKAVEAFRQSSLSKKPGRVLKRLRPLLLPHFTRLELYEWTRHRKLLSGKGLTSTLENRVFHLPDDDRPLYSERAVFMSGFSMSQKENIIGVGVKTGAAISRHAIARLVERGAVDPADLSNDLFWTLEFCACFAGRVFDIIRSETDTDNDNDTDNNMVSYMLPFREGALVAVFMNMDPTQKSEGEIRGEVLSIRTWLGADMISEHEWKRMKGFDLATTITNDDTDSTKMRFRDWVRNNARPWQFSDSTMGDYNRNEIDDRNKSHEINKSRKTNKLDNADKVDEADQVEYDKDDQNDEMSCFSV